MKRKESFGITDDILHDIRRAIAKLRHAEKIITRHHRAIKRASLKSAEWQLANELIGKPHHATTTTQKRQH